MQECRSSSVSLDVYSMQVSNCRCVYPLKVIRPINKYKVDFRPHLKTILDAMIEANAWLKALIADNPKRSDIREALSHASNFACEYCISKAMHFTEINVKASDEKKQNDLSIKQFEKQIRTLRRSPCSTAGLQRREEEIKVMESIITELKKRNGHLLKTHAHTVWPASTSHGELRTKEGILEIVNAIEEQGRSQLTADDVKGIKGRSLLLDLDYFDFVLSIPAEYMHLSCIGVVKR